MPSTATWKAVMYTEINVNDPVAVASKLGVIRTDEDDAAVLDLSTPAQSSSALFFKLNVCLFPPASLDLRSKYIACTSIRTIRNQLNCGSCWAFASMNSLSDRYCIKYSNPLGPAQRAFSPEDLTECAPNSIGGYGCSGGYMNTGFIYAKNTGVCTGEEKANTFLCKPYFLPGGSLPSCQNQCQFPANYPTPYALDKYKIKSYNQITGINLFWKVRNMMCALNTRGTIIAGFTVYQDFFSYSSGVYHHISGGYAGRHAIRIIGYGTWAGTPYWLCANSWGTGWGLGGFFRIRKGVNEVNIESDVWEGRF
jgi:cathepsin B